MCHYVTLVAAGIDAERLHLDRRDFPVANLTTELLYSLPEDTLYSFHATRIR
jgi:hypothetical protein